MITLRYNFMMIQFFYILSFLSVFVFNYEAVSHVVDWTLANTERTAAMGVRKNITIAGQELSYIDAWPTSCANRFADTQIQIVVLLHGFPDDATTWLGVTEVLRTEGYRVIAVDLPGNGLSSAPIVESEYSDYREASWVVAFLSELGLGSVHLVGHDWGGLVTHRLAENFPETVLTATSVAGPHPAVLVGEILKGKLLWGLSSGEEQVKKSAYSSILSAPDGAAQIARQDYAFLRNALSQERLKDSEIEYAIEGLKLRAHTILGHYRNMNAKTMLLEYFYSWFAYVGFGNNEMKIPFLMINPSDDSFFSDGSLRVPNHYSRAQSVIVKGGHFLPTIAPKQVAEELITFWKKQQVIDR